MIYPIKNFFNFKFGYLFGQITHYSSFHLGLDVVCPLWTSIFSPTNGITTNVALGNELGVTVMFKDEYGKLWRFGHLVKAETQNNRQHKEGELLCYTGNTGSIVGNTPHLHFDISNNGKLELNNFNNFIDPLIYIKEHTMAYKPHTIVFSKADKEYYWVRGDGKLLFIPHDRLQLAIAMQIGTTVEESLKAQSIGNF